MDINWYYCWGRMFGILGILIVILVIAILDLIYND